MSKAYYKLLDMLKDELEKDSDIVDGLKEGLRKFLSNLEIKLNKTDEWADYISLSAKARIASGDKTKLVYDHVVPKTRYIQKYCMKAAVTGQFENGEKFSEAAIKGFLERYWKVTVITKEEDDKLTHAGLREKMPKDWDGKDLFARYKAVGITVEPLESRL